MLMFSPKGDSTFQALIPILRDQGYTMVDKVRVCVRLRRILVRECARERVCVCAAHTGKENAS